MKNVKLQAAPLAFTAVIGLGIGLVIGWLAKSSIKPLTSDQQQLLRASELMVRDAFESEPEIIDKIIKSVDTENIKRTLKNIVSKPHLSGTPGDDEFIKSLQSQFSEYGWEDVTITPYNVTLSFADLDKANTVELVEKGTKHVLYRSTLPVLFHRSDWAGFPYPYPFPYLSYTPNGSVTGEPVFVNYGVEEDYDFLVEEGISLKGKIFIAKNGMQPTGKKILLAEKHGAVGLLLYPDPETYAQEGIDYKSVYPKRWWLPEDGIVRSSALDTVGDPATPGYPSIAGVYRHEGASLNLPKIVAQPLNYRDAKEILGRMKGPLAPEEWQGQLDITYNLGPGFGEEFKDIQLKMKSYNKMKNKNIYNIIATIKGAVEPDRYVMIGNHRDAWVAGAVDPASGTAVIMELARIFGSLIKTGWRPRRTIKIGLWGAEEFGLIGSVEWVEDNVLEIQEQAVSYINVDTCVVGETFSPMMSPTLKQAIVKIAKLVPDPDVKNKQLFDTWWSFMKLARKVNEQNDISPTTLGLFSDFAPFLFFAGIPIIDISWQSANHTGSMYPTYHTSYETIEYVEKFLDPGYLRHRACTQFSSLMTLLFSDSAIIPYNFTDLVKEVRYYWSIANSYDEELSTFNISLEAVEQGLHDLVKAVKQWEVNLKKVDRSDPYIVRAINDHQQLMHKAFWSRDTQSSATDSWFFRYGIERDIFSIANAVMQTYEKQSTEIDVAKVEKLLSNTLVMTHQLTKLLSYNFANDSDQARLQTCEPVSTHCIGCPVKVFQKRMHRSAVPPPLASRP